MSTAEYRADDVDVIADSTVAAWLGPHLFADVANRIDGDLTREALLDALRNLSGYDTKGLIVAPLDYTAEDTAMGGTYPNLYLSTTDAWAVEFRDGELRLLNDGNPIEVFG